MFLFASNSLLATWQLFHRLSKNCVVKLEQRLCISFFFPFLSFSSVSLISSSSSPISGKLGRKLIAQRSTIFEYFSPPRELSAAGRVRFASNLEETGQIAFEFLLPSTCLENFLLRVFLRFSAEKTNLISHLATFHFKARSGVSSLERG